MARMIPAHMDPTTSSPGEKVLFHKLASAPGTDDWIVLHSLTLPEHLRQVEGEVDFVIVVPQLGVLCLEVKSHKHVRRDDHGIWQLGSQKPTPRSPFRQAADAMHSLRKQLVKQAPVLERVPFSSAVAFTHVDFKLAVAAEWHQWQVLDASALLSRPIEHHVRAVMTAARDHYRSAGKTWLAATDSPTHEETDIIARKLRPSFELIESRKTARSRSKQELLAYTEEQYAALDALSSAERILFNGPAGTGKTFLALEAARRAADEGLKVLLCCYNKPLQEWLAKQARPGFDVRTFHSHLMHVAKPSSAERSSDWYSHELPDLALDVLLTEGPPYDVLIIDEAQDLLTDEYLNCLDASVKGGLGSGRWIALSDLERQSIYGGTGRIELLEQRAPSFTRFELHANCRNTPSIAEYTRALAGLDSGYKRILRPDNGHMPETLFYDSDEDQGQELARVFQRLRADKFEPSDVVVLSPTKANHAISQLPTDDPWRHRIADGGKDMPGHVQSRTIFSYKGLEAPVVVVTGVADVSSPEAQSLLYVALSRATERLILLCDQQVKQGLLALVTQRLLAGDAT